MRTAVRARPFQAARNPSAPSSGTSCVQQGATRKSRARATSSTASLAITRYVVYLPPATTTSPGVGCATTANCFAVGTFATPFIAGEKLRFLQTEEMK